MFVFAEDGLQKPAAVFLMMLLWILEPIGVASNRVGSNADVVALIVICLGSSFVAIVAGHVALGKIHRSQQKLRIALLTLNHLRENSFS